MTLAPKLPYTHPFSGGYPRLGGQPLPTDPDAIDYLARVAAADGAAVEVGVAMAVDAFIKGCKADGIWDAIKASCIMCGARTITGALVPLAGTAPTPYNFASGDYDRSSGLKGDGSTKYLDSNRANNADGASDRHLACYVSEHSTTNVAFAGGIDTSLSPNSIDQLYWYSPDVLRGYLSSSGGANFAYATLAASTGSFVGTSKSVAGSVDARAAGVTASASSPEHPAPSGVPIHVFARNFNGPNSRSDARLAFYSIGSAVDLAAMDNRVTQLVNGIKFHSLTGLVATDYDPDTVAYIVAAYEAGGAL